MNLAGTQTSRNAWAQWHIHRWSPLWTLCCKAAAAFQALVLPRSLDVVAGPELRHPSSPACQSETLRLVTEEHWCDTNIYQLNLYKSHLIAASPPFDYFDCKKFCVLIPCKCVWQLWFDTEDRSLWIYIVKLPGPSILLDLARIHTCKSLATATRKCFAALPLEKMWNVHKN